MTLIVDASFKLATKWIIQEKKDLVVESWCQTLYGIIPLDYLHKAFHLAFDNHKTNQPISAFELKAAWDEISRNRIANVSTREEHIAQCREAYLHRSPLGDVAYLDPFDPEYDIIMPCATCQPDQFAQKRIDHARNQKTINPIKAFDVEIETILDWCLRTGLVTKHIPPGHPRDWK